MTKNETRELINSGITSFISSGKKITVGKTHGGKKLFSKVKDSNGYIEIDVDALPESLKKFLKEV